MSVGSTEPEYWRKERFSRSWKLMPVVEMSPFWSRNVGRPISFSPVKGIEKSDRTG